MTNNTIDSTDLVKAWVARGSDTLADLRADQDLVIMSLIDNIDTRGVAIGISPNDSILEKYSRGEITDILYNMFDGMRVRGSDGGLVPIAPLTLTLVGEYSPKHRWHYHGIINVTDIKTLEKIKSRIRTKIGRVITEQINNTENYKRYIFKLYLNTKDRTYFCWDKKECYIHVSH